VAPGSCSAAPGPRTSRRGRANQQPANTDWWQPTVLPDGRSRCQPHASCRAAIPAHRRVLPAWGGVAEPGSQRRLTRALLARPTASTNRWWGRVVQRGVQPQPDDDGDRLGQALAGGRPLEHGVTAIGHHHQQLLGQPLPDLGDHLPRLVGELLVRLLTLLVIALGRRQDGQKWQGPHALCPLDGGEQYQAEPAQSVFE